MRIIIAGGSGFIGNALRKWFQSKNYEVMILTRHPKHSYDIAWDGTTISKWIEKLDGADVLINLTGKSVDCRYHEANKKEILRSRIDATNVLQKAINEVAVKPKLWLNASSATIYDHSLDRPNTEENGVVGDDFSMNICKQWEKCFFENPITGVRKVVLRMSIVMGKEGGAYPRFETITKLGLGGSQGNGKQMMSWIHVTDLCRAIDFIIADENLEGVINVTAPKPIHNASFMQLMRNQYKAFVGLPAPKPLLQVAAFFLRTETELLLKSRYVLPEKLLKAGFQFQFEHPKSMIEDLSGKNN